MQNCRAKITQSDQSWTWPPRPQADPPNGQWKLFFLVGVFHTLLLWDEPWGLLFSSNYFLSGFMEFSISGFADLIKGMLTTLHCTAVYFAGATVCGLQWLCNICSWNKTYLFRWSTSWGTFTLASKREFPYWGHVPSNIGKKNLEKTG